MKKTLAILLAFILTFSCFSLALTSTALAEEETSSDVIMQSDFGNTTSTNLWQAYKGSIEQGLQDTDGSYYARLTSSESGTDAPSFYSAPATLKVGYKYELSYYIRVPETSAAYKGTLTTETTSTNYNLTPKLAIYESGISPAGKVNKLYYSVNNEYAYKDIRRSDFEADLTVGSYETKQISKYSLIESNQFKSVYGSELSFNEVFADWTKITFAFTAIASDTNAGDQVVGLNFSLSNAVGAGLMYDIKDVKLVCTDDGTATKTIMQSDFNDADGTNWQATKTGVVTYGDDNGEGYARVKIHPTSKHQGIVSTPFELVPGNDYELTYYIRVPEESVTFAVGSSFYAPTVAFYQTTVNSTGTKVTATPTIDADEAKNNLYAYSGSGWARRKGFSATWTIDGYQPKPKENFSNFGYSDHESVLGATNESINAAFADWTKVTVNFTAVANTEDETSQVTALGFIFHDHKSSDNFVFDIKDVTLTETAPKIQPEPDTTDAIFYEGFEELEDPSTVVNAMSGQSFVEIATNSGDAATGLKSCSVYGMYQHLYIPFDKTKLEADTVYTYSMDWKLLEYTDTKKRNIEKLFVVGYNPDDGAFADNHYDISGKASLKGTGNWETATFNFKISEDKFAAYEQFGIYILYKTSNPYTAAEDTLYIDTLMLKVSDNQDIVTELALDKTGETEDTIKVLAFGNSFSMDGTSFIPQIANAEGVDLRVADCYIGGCPLSKHYNNAVTNATTYNFYYRTPHESATNTQNFQNISMEQALMANDWDYITIQQVSTLSGDPETFEPYLEYLIGKFKEYCPNAEILLHMTWSYKDGITKEGYEKYNNSQTDMYNAIIDTYLQYSEKYDFVRIIPTGETIQSLRPLISDGTGTETDTNMFVSEIDSTTSDVGSFTRDGYHLSNIGRVGVALTWFEVFTGISAADTKIDLTTSAYATVNENAKSIATGDQLVISAEEAAALKEAAHTAASTYKKANEVQKAIAAIGEVTADSGEAIENAKALRAELNNDGLLPNLQTLKTAITIYMKVNPSLEDVTLLAKYFADWDEAVNELDKDHLDISGDGNVNLYDLVKLAQIVAKWSN